MSAFRRGDHRRGARGRLVFAAFALAAALLAVFGRCLGCQMHLSHSANRAGA